MTSQLDNSPSSESITQEPLSLNEFILRLDLLDESISLEELKELMERTSFDESELEPYLQFSDSKYQRNLVASGENYEALLLCFEAGQRTPIHDHAGSACGVKVIQGVATETIFESTDNGWLYPTQSSCLNAGGVVGSADMDVHRLSNLQSDSQRLVTLHVYSPPLGEVGNYSIDDNSVAHVRAPKNKVLPR